MLMGIDPDAVREALRPYLGSPLVENTQLAQQAAIVLRTYAPYRDTLSDVEKRVESFLFNALYALLGDQMTVRRDDGQVVRIRMRELPELADELMGTLFEQLPIDSINYQALREHSMSAGSVNAMRVLYQRFGRLLAENEKQLLARIIRDSWPESRWQSWLAQEKRPVRETDALKPAGTTERKKTI